MTRGRRLLRECRRESRGEWSKPWAASLVDSGSRGGRSSAGRAPGCGPGGRGFESPRSPSEKSPVMRGFSFVQVPSLQSRKRPLYHFVVPLGPPFFVPQALVFLPAARELVLLLPRFAAALGLTRLVACAQNGQRGAGCWCPEAAPATGLRRRHGVTASRQMEQRRPVRRRGRLRREASIGVRRRSLSR